MLKFVAAIVLLAGFAATAPVVAIPSGPPIAKEQRAVEKQQGGSGQRTPNVALGTSNKTPLYIKAECENGCGYAKEEGYWNRLLSDPNAQFAGAVAAFTLFTLFVMIGQWNAADESNRHHRVTERAYVKLSHTSETEFALIWHNDTSGVFEFNMQIKNFGRTPARVTDVYLNCTALPGNSLSLTADSSGIEPRGRTSAFLVEGDCFYRKGALAITPTERTEVEDGFHTLILHGHVDYRDQFGHRHRAGYGRQYDPSAPGFNNLVFCPLPILLNYDREREPGEGRDWNDA